MSVSQYGFMTVSQYGFMTVSQYGFLEAMAAPPWVHLPAMPGTGHHAAHGVASVGSGRGAHNGPPNWFKLLFYETEADYRTIN